MIYDNILAKICDENSLQKLLNQWRNEGLKIVFTNGCFDLIHKGHVDYLAKARDFGDKLIVALNTDRSVSEIKGNNRPLQDEQSRLRIMASFQFTDAVILFDEPTPYEIIQLIQPDVLVKGADYQVADIVGYDIVTAKGGLVKTLEFLPGYSTSMIEQKIKNQY